MPDLSLSSQMAFLNTRFHTAAKALERNPHATLDLASNTVRNAGDPFLQKRVTEAYAKLQTQEIFLNSGQERFFEDFSKTYQDLLLACGAQQTHRNETQVRQGVQTLFDGFQSAFEDINAENKACVQRIQEGVQTWNMAVKTHSEALQFVKSCAEGSVERCTAEETAHDVWLDLCAFLPVGYRGEDRTLFYNAARLDGATLQYDVETNALEFVQAGQIVPVSTDSGKLAGWQQTRTTLDARKNWLAAHKVSWVNTLNALAAKSVSEKPVTELTFTNLQARLQEATEPVDLLLVNYKNGVPEIDTALTVPPGLTVQAFWQSVTHAFGDKAQVYNNETLEVENENGSVYGWAWASELSAHDLQETVAFCLKPLINIDRPQPVDANIALNWDAFSLRAFQKENGAWLWNANNVLIAQELVNKMDAEVQTLTHEKEAFCTARAAATDARDALEDRLQHDVEKNAALGWSEKMFRKAFEDLEWRLELVSKVQERLRAAMESAIFTLLRA